MESDQSATPPPLRAHLLGATRIALGAQPILERAWSGRSARALLLLLLATPGHRLARDRVLEMLWPEATPEAATNALYKAAHALRRVLEPNLRGGRASAYVVMSSESVGLAPHSVTWVDADAFAVALGRAGAFARDERRAVLRDALLLYEGDLLADEPYTDWPVPRRESLRLMRENAVLALAELDRDAGVPLATIPFLETLLAADPTVESAYRAIMRAYASSGQRDRALRQYQRCRDAIFAELGVEPSPETEALIAEIEATPTPVRRQESTAGRTAFFNVPASPSSLIGRDAEVEAVQTFLWRPDVRLVTVTGVGGIGKTRLALEVATGLREDFADGVVFVGLAPVRDPALIITTIAQTLGVRDEGGQSAAERLQAMLADREMLLVLDNFEHLLAGVGIVADLLAACHQIKLLVTSRETLRLRWEHEYELRPLPLPNLDRLPPLPSLLRFGAVALLDRELRRNRPGFSMSPDQTATLAEMCVRLDGLPLAIELAAARGRTFSPEELLEQLENRLALLTVGPRDLPERQRTLRNTIAWSYDLLTDPEQTLFRRLSVFAGGCIVEAALAVCEADEGIEDHKGTGDRGQRAGREESPARCPRSPVPSLFVALAEKHLVRMDEVDGGIRIMMLETIREFARERLAAHSEIAMFEQRHAMWVRALVERVEPRLVGSGQAEAVERLDLEHGNIRAALSWAMTHGDAETANRIVAAVYRFWMIRGHASEGRTWAEAALALPQPSPRVLARALDTMGRLLDDTGEIEQAGPFHERALAIWQRLGDRSGIASSLTDAGNVARDCSDLPRSRSLHETALTIHRELGNRYGEVRNLNGLAAVATYQGEYGAAAGLFAAAADVSNEIGDQWSRATALSNAGSLAHALGDIARARQLAQESLAVRRRLGDSQGIAVCLFNLATSALDERDWTEATRLFAEAHERFEQVHSVSALAQVATGYGIAALMQGDLVTAARYLSQALPAHERGKNAQRLIETMEAVAQLALFKERPALATEILAVCAAERESVGIPVPPNQEVDLAVSIGRCRDALGENAFDDAWAVGKGRSLAQVVANALAMMGGTEGTISTPL